MRHAGAHRGAGVQHPARLQAQVEGAEEGEVPLRVHLFFFILLFMNFIFQVPLHMQGVPRHLPLDQERVRHRLQVGLASIYRVSNCDPSLVQPIENQII